MSRPIVPIAVLGLLLLGSAATYYALQPVQHRYTCYRPAQSPYCVFQIEGPLTVKDASQAPTYTFPNGTAVNVLSLPHSTYAEGKLDNLGLAMAAPGALFLAFLITLVDSRRKDKPPETGAPDTARAYIRTQTWPWRLAPMGGA